MSLKIIGSSFAGTLLSNARSLGHSFSKITVLQPHQLIIEPPFPRSHSSVAKRGEIYIVAPNTEFEGGAVADFKKGSRPGVVISSDLAIKETDSVMLARLSGSAKKHKFEVLIPSDETTGLHKTSKLMTNQIFTVKQETCATSKKLGIVSTDLMKKVDQELKTAFSPYIKLPNATPKFSRGDIVEIPVGNGRLGVVVSNDLGNQMSEIVMMSHISINHLSDTPLNSVNSGSQMLHTRNLGEIAANAEISQERTIHQGANNADKNSKRLGTCVIAANQFEVNVKVNWLPGYAKGATDLTVSCNEVDTVAQHGVCCTTLEVQAA